METERIVLRSKVQQNDETYYVMILESTLLIDESISYANKILILVLLLFISIGGLAVNFLAKKDQPSYHRGVQNRQNDRGTELFREGFCEKRLSGAG